MPIFEIILCYFGAISTVQNIGHRETKKKRRKKERFKSTHTFLQYHLVLSLKLILKLCVPKNVGQKLNP